MCTYGHDLSVEDEEVQEHGEEDGAHEPPVGPWRHDQQRLVLTQTGNTGRRSVSNQSTTKYMTASYCMFEKLA